MNDTALSKRGCDGLKAATEIMLEQRIDDEHWQPDPAVISRFGIPRLLCLPNVGRKTIEEIKDWLAAYRRALEDEQRKAIRRQAEAEERRCQQVTVAQSVLSRIEISGPDILAKLDPEELDVVKTALEAFSITGVPQNHPPE
jgi:hypothetical protein